jgi:AraC family transcriptional regulator
MDGQSIQPDCRPETVQEMLIDAETGDLRPIVRRSPELASDPVAWPSVRIEVHGAGIYENPPSMPVNHVLVYSLDGKTECESSDGGPFRPHCTGPGQFSLYPASVLFAARARVEGRFFTVSITPQFLALHTRELTRGKSVALPSLRGVSDSVCTAIGEQIRNEAAVQNPQGRVYVEALAGALAVHLVRKYGQIRSEKPARGGLSPSQLRQAIACIRERLTEDLPLAAMAKAAGLSPFHFARRFKQATGLAPHQYLVVRRLEHARQLLVDTETPLVEVARRSGFCDQSHFTAHFRRQFGVTPRVFRGQYRG